MRLSGFTASVFVACFAAGAVHPYSIPVELTLTQRTGEKTISSVERIAAAPAGFEATIETSLGEYDRVIMDRDRSTLEWRRSFPAEGTELTAKRDGRFVNISGRLKNTRVSERKDIGDLPWFQFQEISYPALLERQEDRTEFWTIGRNDLRFTRFLSERQANETIVIQGKAVEAIHSHLTVDGVPAFLFRSSFWIRRSDGIFLRLEVPAILGMPATTVELSGEKR